MRSSRETTVKNLQELYTVAVGVALVVAMAQIVPPFPEGERAHVRWTYLPAFGTFLATLVPFYHGALRHLDQRYVEERGRAVREGALLADFFLLFLESCLFLGIAGVLADIRAVAWGIAALLMLDVVWGTGMYLVFARVHRAWAELKWVRLNLVFGPMLILGLLALRSIGSERLAIALLVAAVLRSTIDYRLSWHFYFPAEVAR